MKKTPSFAIPCLAIVCLAVPVGRALASDAAVPGQPAAPAQPASSGAAPLAKKIDWAKMTVAERKQHMKAIVLPEMKKLFVAVDAKRYANMSCETCHGAKATETKFKMPNPDLVKLPPPMDRAGFTALHAKKPEMAKFMGSKVKPTMASLLGLEEWSPTNATGFGCYACHAKEGDAPAQPKVADTKAAAPALVPAKLLAEPKGVSPKVVDAKVSTASEAKAGKPKTAASKKKIAKAKSKAHGKKSKRRSKA